MLDSNLGEYSPAVSMKVGYPLSSHPQTASVHSLRILIGFDWSTRIIASIALIAVILSVQRSSRRTPALSARRSPKLFVLAKSLFKVSARCAIEFSG
jgi:hypothetical protein